MFQELLASPSSQEAVRSAVRTEHWDDVKVLVSQMTIYDRQVTVRRVERSELIRGRTIFAENLGGDDAFFVGLNSAGHMYLVANVYRYDGKLAFEKPQLNTRSSLLDRGLVIRIADPEGKIQDQIIAYFRQKGPPRSLDCAAGVCKLVSEAAGIELAQNVRQRVLPHELMRQLITQGVRGTDGRRQQTQLFVIGNAEPQTVLQAAERVSRQYIRTATPYLAGAGLATVGIIATFVNLFI